MILFYNSDDGEEEKEGADLTDSEEDKIQAKKNKFFGTDDIVIGEGEINEKNSNLLSIMNSKAITPMP